MALHFFLGGGYAPRRLLTADVCALMTSMLRRGVRQRAAALLGRPRNAVHHEGIEGSFCAMQLGRTEARVDTVDEDLVPVDVVHQLARPQHVEKLARVITFEAAAFE